MAESVVVPTVLLEGSSPVLEGSSPVLEEEEVLEVLPLPLPLASPERSDMDQHKFRVNIEKFIVIQIYAPMSCW